MPGLPHIGSPNTRMLPWLGFSWPVISFMNVDLPAPFGPSRPVMPGGMLTVTSFSPLTWPYHLDRCSAWTSASTAPGCWLGGGDSTPDARLPTPEGYVVVT